MDIQNFLLAIVAIANFIWGLLVFFQNYRKKPNIVFSLVIFSVVFWTMSMILYRTVSSSYTLIWCRILYVAAILIPLFFLYFNLVFPDSKRCRNYFSCFLISVPALLLVWLTVYTDLIINNAYNVLGQENIIVFGSLYFLYAIYIIGYFNWSFGILWVNYKGYKGIIRAQVRYILIGAFMASAIAMLTNLILPWFSYFFFNWLGQVATIFWVSFTAYAMLRYRLMDIRVVARNVFMYFGLSVLIYVMYYGVAFIYLYFFGAIFATGTYILGVFLAPTFVFVFYGFNRLWLVVANRYLFSNLYNYQEAISNLSQQLNYHTDLDKIIGVIVDSIKKTMQLNRAGVLIVNAQKKPVQYQIAKVIGFNRQNGISLVEDNFLTKYLEKTQKPLVLDELDLLASEAKTRENRDGFLRLKDYMGKIEASLCLPLMSNRELIGIIVLGSKLSGDAYTREDLGLLMTLSNQAGIAIDNARMYKKIQEFNATLKQKVNEQTRDIKNKNRYLEELINMKSDFLRVVNHQLNTPLSIMRSSFAMMKDRTIDQKKGLKIAGNGLERMSQTIADFWDAFQLEGEKMELSPEKTDIVGIVKDLVEEKKKLPLAIERKLKIEIKKPEFAVPAVFCDSKKIVHVFSNLLDNAVFYTAKGGVKVSYFLDGRFLKISFADTGKGLSAENQKKLFQKFFRGQGATNLHPDGSGLGLYIAKKIAVESGGGLVAESAGEGRGSTFILSLPIYNYK